jgi:predicted MPP superfamily phosphohydrolase
VLAVALGLLCLYGVLIEPRLILDERRYERDLPAIGEDPDPVEIAFFSDLQIGMWWANTGMVERVVEKAVAEEPAAVLIGGDFLYSTDPGIDAQITTLLDLLAPLTDSGIPVFAVLGNHDYAIGAADGLTTALENEGVTVLLNESATLPDPDGRGPDLHIVGLGSPHAGSVDPQASLRNVPDGEPRVVMMHNPMAFPELPADSAPLALAGHTHCGQITLPGLPQWSYLGLTKEEALVADGFAFKEYGAPGNSLFVTCGIGFSLIPARIAAPPQIDFFELG